MRRKYSTRYVSTNGGPFRCCKLAAGMAATAKRSGHWAGGTGAPPALSLSVSGTLDCLSSGMLSYRREFVPSKCPCCGQTVRKARLNDAGRNRLSAKHRQAKDG